MHSPHTSRELPRLQEQCYLALPLGLHRAALRPEPRPTPPPPHSRLLPGVPSRSVFPRPPTRPRGPHSPDLSRPRLVRAPRGSGAAVRGRRGSPRHPSRARAAAASARRRGRTTASSPEHPPHRAPDLGLGPQLPTHRQAGSRKAEAPLPRPAHTSAGSRSGPGKPTGRFPAARPPRAARDRGFQGGASRARGGASRARRGGGASGAAGEAAGAWLALGSGSGSRRLYLGPEAANSSAPAGARGEGLGWGRSGAPGNSDLGAAARKEWVPKSR